MAHQFDTGLFVNADGSQEWHGLGRVVKVAPKTTHECMELAGMDWTVKEGPIVTVTEDGQPNLIDGWKVLQRSDTGTTLNVCRDSWTPVQNHEAFSWFDPIIADGDAAISAAVSLNEGKRIAITAKLKDGIGDVTSGDPVEAYLLLFNSHDGTLSLGMKFTNVRVVCANTLAIALRGERSKIGEEITWSEKTARIKHTKSIHDNMQIVRDAMDYQKRMFKYSLEEYQAMAKVDLSIAAFNQYVTNVFQAVGTLDDDKNASSLRFYDRLVENFESGTGSDIRGFQGTAWGAYNAVTEFTSHQRNGDDVDAARKRLNSLWFGQGEMINKSAHACALALV